MNPKLNSIRPECRGEKMLISEQSGDALVDCLHFAFQGVLKLRINSRGVMLYLILKKIVVEFHTEFRADTSDFGKLMAV